MAALQPDLGLVGGKLVFVRDASTQQSDIAITKDRISGIGSNSRAVTAREVINVTGRFVVPGYIEPHTHFSIVNPAEYAGALLRQGTTIAVVDALPLMLLAKPDRLAELLERMAGLPMKMRHLIRLHSQAISDENRFGLETLRRLWRLPSVAAVGEVTRWVDVLHGDPDLLAKMRAARQDGRRIEGHAPGASYERLVALAEAGFTSCHEAITAGEVEDRLRAGLATMLRHSPIRQDLPELLTAVKNRPEWLDQVMLTVDGPTPVFIDDHGYLDYLMQIAIEQGIEPMKVLRMVTINPAAYFGFTDAGEIAVGKRADLNVLNSLDDPTPVMTIADGRVVAEHGRLVAPLPRIEMSGMVEEVPLPRLRPEMLVANSDTPAMRMVNDVITEIVPTGEAPEGSLHVAMIDQRGRWITRTRLVGLVDQLGGLATTFTSSFGDVIVAGQSPEDMAAALSRVAQDSGGVAVVENGVERFRLAFEDRVYSRRPWAEIVAANREFNALMRARGYRFNDPLISLLFLTFDSLPWIRLTSRGVWDVRNRRAFTPAVPL